MPSIYNLKICNVLLESQQPTAPAPESAELINLTVVVPCYNEEDGLDQLADRLKTLKSHFSERLDIEVIFVDDGSTDNTAEGLDNRFQQFSWARVIQHESHQGITAAILQSFPNGCFDSGDTGCRCRHCLHTSIDAS